MDIDDMFDLDLALTMPEPGEEEVPVKPKADAESRAAARRLVDAMPEVMAGVDCEYCIVCMEGFRSAECGKRIPCGHVFHHGCIFEWLSSMHNSCPLCRGNIAL